MIAYIAAGLIGLTLAWMGISAMSVQGVKEPPYAVEREGNGYEVRRYQSYLVAEAQLPPDSEDPLEKGFRMLFAYIGGANSGSREIDMTAPVLQEPGGGEKIPMTKPVLSRREQEINRVAFVMPQDLTLESAPRPENEAIRIREVPQHRVAVLRFSGYADDERMEEKRRELAALLERDQVRTKGEYLYAYYDPPWTPPFMRRNEVMVEIE